MGVFARLLRRSKATAETPAAEAQTDTAKAGPETEAAEAVETKGTGGAEEPAEPTAEATSEASKSTESEGVDIPKQQSTEKAADNEAGEGART
ncbi:hypothetical protein SAMN06272771_5884 [Streptomyces sp. Ag82_O1-12]|uniref:hypothetical protein n=1 Tax=unclassified Streptomyces TaxID=2593676 RepID=UPI000BD03035|nr:MULTISPECIES: hypothetical protein [unclassified Streptomyces]SMQ19404.1 hypothetical protein SAMN06272771_5884 [Streptomyces sp. Ag82_O1-12]SOD48445.1 hypothetical protein SAMN06272727_5887 [Streptomyces sp. Ag82_G6-1]